MATILADDHFKCIFYDHDRIPLRIHWNMSQEYNWFYNKQVLFHVMAWRRTGDKPLPEPMLMQLTGAYTRH